MKRLPNLLYEHTPFAVLAHNAEVRAKLRAKRQEREVITSGPHRRPIHHPHPFLVNKAKS
jgi:hypothetical protein